MISHLTKEIRPVPIVGNQYSSINTENKNKKQKKKLINYQDSLETNVKEWIFILVMNELGQFWNIFSCFCKTEKGFVANGKHNIDTEEVRSLSSGTRIALPRDIEIPSSI